MTRQFKHCTGNNRSCRRHLWPVLMLMLAVVFLVVPRNLTARENLSLAAGIAVNKAQTLMTERKSDQALAVLTEFYVKQDGNVHHYIDFLLGICHIELGQTGKAAESFLRAVEKQPDLSAAWLNLARCRYEQGEMAEAARAFEKGYDTSEERQAVHLYYAAVCQLQAGHPDPALAVFERLMAGHPGEVSLEWKQTLVNILFALEKYREALPWLEELADVTQSESRRQWQEMLLYQYLSLKMKNKALEYALFLTRTHPEEPGWWKALAHVHLTENRYEKALASMLGYSYLTALTREEIRLVADLYLACNIPQSAAQYYETLLEQHRDDLSETQVLERIKAISRAWMTAGNPDLALAWAEKGLAQKPDPDLVRIRDYVLAIRKIPDLKEIHN